MPRARTRYPLAVRPRTILQERFGPTYVKRGLGVTPGRVLRTAAGFVPGLGPIAQPMLGVAGPQIHTPIGEFGLGNGGCPPGTRCRGVSYQGPLGEICIGGCAPIPGYEGPGVTPFFPADEEPGVGLPAEAVTTELCCPSGYHPNRSDYFLKDGTFVPEGSRCVRNRRRNPLNPDAADRAIGRLRSASRFGKYLAKIDLPAKGTRKR